MLKLIFVSSTSAAFEWQGSSPYYTERALQLSWHSGGSAQVQLKIYALTDSSSTKATPSKDNTPHSTLRNQRRGCLGGTGIVFDSSGLVMGSNLPYYRLMGKCGVAACPEKTHDDFLSIGTSV